MAGYYWRGEMDGLNADPEWLDDDTVRLRYD